MSEEPLTVDECREAQMWYDLLSSEVMVDDEELDLVTDAGRRRLHDAIAAVEDRLPADKQGLVWRYALEVHVPACGLAHWLWQLSRVDDAQDKAAAWVFRHARQGWEEGIFSAREYRLLEVFRELCLLHAQDHEENDT